MERLGLTAEFVTMKPVCDRLANEPTIQNVMRLGDLIQRHTTAAIQYHLEFILFPIYVHLHNENLSDDVKQNLIQLLRLVLSKSRITTLNYFLKIYTALLVQIYDPHQPNMLIKAHEELKESTMKCLADLMKSNTSDVIESLYIGENAPKLSQGVYTCLSIARTEKLCSLRVAALETLMTLSNVHDNADDNDVALRNQVADIFMLFLPGIASSLCQIALESELQSHRITLMAIRAYGRIISLVMANNIEEEDLTIDSLQNIENLKKSEDPLGMRLKLEGNKGMKRYIEMAKRNQEWLDAASIKLNASMQSLMNLVRHSHFRVRKELVLAVKLIISKCSRHMIKNYTVLVEMLISLSEDEVEEVKNLARLSLNDDINAELTKNYNMRPVVQVLEENFYKLLTKLPRLIRRSDDTIQICYLNQLAGYIRLLGKERLPHVMASSSHLKRLVLALVYIAELDCSRVSLMEDVQVKDIEDSTHINLQSFKCFKFIKETGTEEKLTSVCNLLGELGDPVLLVDCIFEIMLEMPQYRNELTLLLNWITAVPVENSSMLAVLKQLNNYYTNPENWYFPIQVEKNVTLGDAQKNVVYCCLVTSGLGIIANNLQEKYQEHLLKTLYLVIERAGSGNRLLSECGLKTLETIAHSQNYTNIAELLRDNVDYISYHMTTKMHRVERNPGVLDVFSVVMKYSTMKLLACPKEVVEVALVQLSANSHQQNSYSLLKILYVFVVCIRKMTENPELGDSTELRENSLTQNPAEIVVQSVLDYYNAKKNSERLDDEIITTPDEIEMELEDGTAAEFAAYDNHQDEKVIPPSHINMTESVMKCCLNFLPSKEVLKSLLAMQIMEEGLFILAKWNEQLLPIVHQLWHPLIGRFNDSNILVIKQAWQLLYTLADVSQDFIRSRTLKQVLPSLSQFLMTSAKDSYKKDSKSAYKFTQMFKLQRMILAESATLAKNLKLQERQLWEMLDIAQTYLSDNQHPVLQECCVNLFMDVAKFQADIVWVKCLSVWNNNIARIPTDSNPTLEYLKEIMETLMTILQKTIPKTGAHQSDYLRNIEKILIFVEEMPAKNL